MQKDEWMAEFSNWLGSFPWRWFASLTFRPGISAAQRRWRLRLWMEQLQAELGDENFQWFGVPENGRTGQNVHYHTLIGGLRGWHARERLRWMKKWNRLCGDALITPFNPAVGGVRYILKHVQPNDMDDLELHINSHTTMQSKFGAK